MKMNRPRPTETPKQEGNLKQTIAKMIQENPQQYDSENSSNELLIAQSLIESARNGNPQSIKILSDLTNQGENTTTPEIKVNIVDNTRLEKFMYMTEEELKKFEEEHEGQKEYKITCLSEEAKQKLDEEYPDKKSITEGGTNYDTEKKSN